MPRLQQFWGIKGINKLIAAQRDQQGKKLKNSGQKKNIRN